jgi:threonine/homoserine efflux transporter RhtA
LICSGICDFFASLFSIGIEIVIGIEFAGIIVVYDFDGDFDGDNLYR